MKIDRVLAIKCGAFSYLKVITVEGVYGIGETILSSENLLIAYAQELSKKLHGQDPLNIEKIWIEVYTDWFWAHTNAILSALDVALWDIKGKFLGVPVYQLIGGKTKERIRLYTHLRGTWNSFPDKTKDSCFPESWYQNSEPEQLAENAQELVSRGYNAIKFDPFHVIKDGYDNYRPLDIKKAVDKVEKVRESVGFDVDLMVECHCKFNVSTAIKIGKELERFQLMWIEEPIAPNMLQGMKRFMDVVNIPVTNGEKLSDKLEMKQYMENHACDIINFDCGKVGGITEALKMFAMAEAYQVKVTGHNPFSMVNAVASAHLMIAKSNGNILEWEDFVPSIFLTDTQINNGYMYLSEEPGLGIDLNMEEIQRIQRRVHSGEYSYDHHNAVELHPRI